MDFQSALPVRPATKAERMRDCLRNLKQQNKVACSFNLKSSSMLLIFVRQIDTYPSLHVNTDATVKTWEFYCLLKLYQKLCSPCSFRVESFNADIIILYVWYSIWPNYGPFLQQDDDAKVKRAFQTLLTYIGNVAKNPDEEKFRKIRLSNATFQVKIITVHIDLVKWSAVILSRTTRDW